MSTEMEVTRSAECLRNTLIRCEHEWSEPCLRMAVAVIWDGKDYDAHWHVCEQHAKAAR